MILAYLVQRAGALQRGQNPAQQLKLWPGLSPEQSSMHPAVIQCWSVVQVFQHGNPRLSRAILQILLLAWPAAEQRKRSYAGP